MKLYLSRPGAAAAAIPALVLAGRGGTPVTPSATSSTNNAIEVLFVDRH